MELADFIQVGQRAPALRFLIIGGYAVAAHGHTRATFDVDFLARHAERAVWFARLDAAGLSLFGETKAFAQFSPSEDGDGLNLRDPRYEQLFLKYGTRELYDTFLRLLRNP